MLRLDEVVYLHLARAGEKGRGLGLEDVCITRHCSCGVLRNQG